MTPMYVARCPGKVALYETGSDVPKQTYEPASIVHTSADATKIYIATPDAVDVYSTTDPSKKLGSIPEPGVVLISESPAGGFLVTATKASKGAEGEGPVKNLKVWSLATFQAVVAVPLKQVNKDSWPAVQWSHNDDACIITATNNLNVYHAADNFASYKKCAWPGVTSCSVSPTHTYGRLAAVFTAESKGSPASAALVDYTQANPTARVRKAFYRTQGASFMWSAKGGSVLVLSYADYDATNQSYYGEQKLHFLPADPAKADQTTTVPLPKDGPVHDVQWSPAGDYFVTVAGFMPAKATLWDANCKPIFDFGSGPYNLVRWNPFGRFIALAGFGNLPGDILFWDKLKSGTCKQMGATRCPAVSASWAPDGRSLMVATTAPRLRVDNSVKTITYYGLQASALPFDILFEASWVPVPKDTYTDRPQSPERRSAVTNGAGSGGQGPVASPAAKPAGYVPPHLRNSSGAAVSGAPKPSFSLGFDANDKGGRIASARPGAPQSASSAVAARNAAVPGFDFVDPKAAAKNAKKRANKKKASGEAGQDDEDEGAASVAAAGVAALNVSAASQPSEGAAGEGAAGPDPEKRIRALQKKLRQIRDLKDKMAAQGEKAMGPEQLAKIKTEQSIVDEITSLGGTA